MAPIAKNPKPLAFEEVPEPKPKADEVSIQVSVCGVCHTELDEIEGRTKPSQLPRILGHQVVGVIEDGKNKGQRVGVAWIYSACGKCKYCLSGNENLCEQFQATGRDANGGYAEYMTARETSFIHSVISYRIREAAPLLCAGAVGYRALRLANIEDGQSLGLMGFGG